MKNILTGIVVVTSLVIVMRILIVNVSNRGGEIPIIPAAEYSSAPISTPSNTQSEPTPVPTQKDGVISVPLDRPGERVIKKPFGIYIDPKTSPVKPEKFRGYHTGTDFETFPEESTADVSVRAVCPGTIVVKKRASGYGGVVVEQCIFNGQQATVIYGHLALRSVTIQSGDTIEQGSSIGLLGAGYSADTDGERKHLHLGIHKGTSIDIQGYVANKQELSRWIDPCTLLCQ
jgi:murein DD-endopeptidase MepM/ murein hydrolase activator NlpD